MRIIPKKKRENAKLYIKVIYISFYTALVCIIIPAIFEMIGYTAPYWLRAPFGIIGLCAIIGVFYCWVKYMNIGVKYGTDVLKKPTKREERDYKLNDVLNEK